MRRRCDNSGTCNLNQFRIIKLRAIAIHIFLPPPRSNWANKDEMPLSIGAFGFWFPNSRSYDYVELRASA